MNYDISTWSILGCVAPKDSCFRLGDFITPKNCWTYTVALIQKGKMVDTAIVSERPLAINKKSFPHLKTKLFSKKIKGKIYTFYTGYEKDPNDLRCVDNKYQLDGIEWIFNLKTCASILGVDFDKLEYWVNDCNITFNEKGDLSNFSYSEWFKHMIVFCLVRRLNEYKNDSWIKPYYNNNTFSLPDDAANSPAELKEFMKQVAKDIEYQFNDIGVKTCVRFCGKNDFETLKAFSTPEEKNHRGFGSFRNIK